MMSGKLLLSVLAAGLLLAAAPASAAVSVLVLTLDDTTIPGGVMCGDTWVEAGVTLSFVPTTAEDCSEGNCFFGLDPTGVWLYPCRLNVDLSGICGVVSAEVDVTDYCGVACTRAFFYEGATTVDSDSNTIVNAPETLLLSAGTATVDRMAVSSCEGLCTEIRITYDASASGTESATWGSVKVLYR
jgi:hypothetical protein